MGLCLPARWDYHHWNYLLHQHDFMYDYELFRQSRFIPFQNIPTESTDRGWDVSCHGNDWIFQLEHKWIIGESTRPATVAPHRHTGQGGESLFIWLCLVSTWQKKINISLYSNQPKRKNVDSTCIFSSGFLGFSLKSQPIIQICQVIQSDITRAWCNVRCGDVGRWFDFIRYFLPFSLLFFE